MHGQALDNRVRHYAVLTDLHADSSLGTMNIDHALVTALVERWRQEIHFHLQVGEATVML